MKAIGQSSVEIAVEEIVRGAFVQLRKSDTENDRRLVDMALRCGDLERQLADERIAKVRLLNENELLREDLDRERNALVLMTGTDGVAN